MTDTKRSSSPRALLKDRSLSRDVKGGKGLKKNGAGGHNWGRAGAEEFEFDEENFGDNQEEEEYEGTIGVLGCPFLIHSIDDSVCLQRKSNQTSPATLRLLNDPAS